jgi:hypothetical protein
MSKPDREFKGPFWTDRGIDADVAKRRGYRFWEDGNPEEVRKVYKEEYGLEGGVLGTLTRWAKGDPEDGKPGHGVLIMRHALPGCKRIVPEIRPTDAIVTDTTRHYHGLLPYDPEADYNVVDGEHQVLPDNHVHGPRTALQHRLKHHSDLSDDKYREYIRRRDHEGLRLEDLEAQGIIDNSEVPHEHDHEAKYLFPPSGNVEKPFRSDHDEDFSFEPTEMQILLYAVLRSPWPWIIAPVKQDPKRKIRRDTKLRVAKRLLAAVKQTVGNQIKRRDKHLEKYHEDGVPAVIGEHCHGRWYHRHSSYTDAAKLERHVKRWHHGKAPEDLDRKHRHCFKAKARDKNHAKRIEANPIAQERIKRAGVLFFPIEGCLKADALLSAIIREGWNASVISVPSVSLWLTPELEGHEFTEKYLRGKVVVIVPDADWYEKGQVITQALLCHSYLVDKGVTALDVCCVVG